MPKVTQPNWIMNMCPYLIPKYLDVYLKHHLITNVFYLKDFFIFIFFLSEEK